jgi:hypothetical protein
MGVFLALIVAFSLWVVMWALEVNAIDGFMLVLLIVLVAAIVRIVAPFLPGNRPGDY